MQGCATSPNDSRQQLILKNAAEDLRSATNAAASNQFKRKVINRLEVWALSAVHGFILLDKEICITMCTGSLGFILSVVVEDLRSATNAADSNQFNRLEVWALSAVHVFILFDKEICITMCTGSLGFILSVVVEDLRSATNAAASNQFKRKVINRLEVWALSAVHGFILLDKEIFIKMCTGTLGFILSVVVEDLRSATNAAASNQFNRLEVWALSAVHVFILFDKEICITMCTGSLGFILSVILEMI